SPENKRPAFPPASCPLFPELPWLSSPQLSAIAALRVAHASPRYVVPHTPQTTSKPFGELVACAPQTRLQSIFGDAQLFRGCDRPSKRLKLRYAESSPSCNASSASSVFPSTRSAVWNSGRW